MGSGVQQQAVGSGDRPRIVRHCPCCGKRHKAGALRGDPAAGGKTSRCLLDERGTLREGHLEVLGQALDNLAGGPEPIRLNFADGLFRTANALRERGLGEVQRFAPLLEPLPERWRSGHREVFPYIPLFIPLIVPLKPFQNTPHDGVMVPSADVSSTKQCPWACRAFA